MAMDVDVVDVVVDVVDVVDVDVVRSAAGEPDRDVMMYGGCVVRPTGRRW